MAAVTVAVIVVLLLVAAASGRPPASGRPLWMSISSGEAILA